MGIYLLQGAGPSTVGNPVDTRSIDRIQIGLRIDAIGGFAGSAVIVEESPDGGTTWLSVGTLTNGQQLVIQAPVDRVRARTDGALTGAATVIAEISG